MMHPIHRFYRPQRIVAKVMFLLVSVILSTGGSPRRRHPREGGNPPRRRPPRRESPKKETPKEGGTPPEGDPPGRRPPKKEAPRRRCPRRRPSQKEATQEGDPPKETPPEGDPLEGDSAPLETNSGIRSMSGRYASYWNAFLLCLNFIVSLSEDCLSVSGTAFFVRSI